MSVKGWAIGTVALFAIVGSCSDDEQRATGVPAAGAGVAAAPAGMVSAAPVAAPAPITPPAPSGVAVTRVLDGDTFEIAGGHRVEVLGIDACDLGTYGGEQAKQAAEVWLSGQSVVLESEPGTDRDRSGRLLRYVSTTSGTDLGEMMVVSSHTGVADADSGASPQRLAALRASDYSGQDCSAPQYTSSDETDVDVDVDSDVNMPDGALTGGYCARKWWC